MEDPLQINLGDRNSRVELIRRTSAPPVTVRAYGNPAPPEDEQDDLATLLHYLGMLWKHKWVLLLSATLGGLLSFWMVLRTTPMYHAKASLEIQRIPQPFGQPVVVETTTDTQIQILSSRTLKGRALAMVPAAPENGDAQTYGLLADIRKNLNLKDPANSIDWNTSLQLASASVTISKAKENSTILDIQTDTTNPEAAAKFVNSLAHVFINATQEQKLEAYDTTGSWMKDEQERLKASIESSERQLAQFAREKGLIFTDSPAGTSGTQTVGEEALKTLQRQLADARNDQVSVQSQHPAVGDPAAVLDSPRLANLQSQIGDLEAQRDQLLVNLTPKNEKVQEIDAKLAQLQTQKQEELATIQLRNKKQMDGATNRVAILTAEFEKKSQEISRQSDDLIKYNILKREIDTNKGLYTTMLEQGKAASIASAMRNSSARIVDNAIPLRTPVKPDLPFTLGLGLLGGFCCGAGFVIIRSRADLTVHEPGSLELSLNLRELGVIPSARVDKKLRNLRAFKRLPSATVTPRTLGTVDCLEMVATMLTPSAMAEAFRSTMTSLLLTSEGGVSPKVLVFTSASPGEGKTTGYEFGDLPGADQSARASYRCRYATAACSSDLRHTEYFRTQRCLKRAATDRRISG